jgi:hypothetical protein
MANASDETLIVSLLQAMMFLPKEREALSICMIILEIVNHFLIY